MQKDESELSEVSQVGEWIYAIVREIEFEEIMAATQLLQANWSRGMQHQQSEGLWRRNQLVESDDLIHIIIFQYKRRCYCEWRYLDNIL